MYSYFRLQEKRNWKFLAIIKLHGNCSELRFFECRIFYFIFSLSLATVGSWLLWKSSKRTQFCNHSEWWTVKIKQKWTVRVLKLKGMFKMSGLCNCVHCIMLVYANTFLKLWLNGTQDPWRHFSLVAKLVDCLFENLRVFFKAKLKEIVRIFSGIQP